MTQSWGSIPFFTVMTKAAQYIPVWYWCRTVDRILKMFFYTGILHNRNFSLLAEVSFLISTMSLLAVRFLPVKVMPLKALIYSVGIIPLHTWKWLYWHKAPLSWDNQIHAKAGCNAFNNTSTVREPAITCWRQTSPLLKTPFKTAVFYKNGAPFLPKTNEIWYRKSTWHRIFIRNVTQTWETSQCNKTTDLQRQQNMTKCIMRNKSETTFSLYLERWLFFIHFNHKFLKIRPHLYQEQAAKGYIALTF